MVTMNREKQTHVYWIHYPNKHTDLMSEGYVGITNDLYHREWRHRNNEGNPIAYNGMQKGAVFMPIEQYSTRDSALEREIELRPTDNIGWNITAGGNAPPLMTDARGKDPAFRKAVTEGVNRAWANPSKARLEKFASKEFSDRMKEVSKEINAKFLQCQYCSQEIVERYLANHEERCFMHPSNIRICKIEGCDNIVNTLRTGTGRRPVYTAARPEKKCCSRQCSDIARRKSE